MFEKGGVVVCQKPCKFVQELWRCGQSNMLASFSGPPCRLQHKNIAGSGFLPTRNNILSVTRLSLCAGSWHTAVVRCPGDNTAPRSVGQSINPTRCNRDRWRSNESQQSSRQTAALISAVVATPPHGISRQRSSIRCFRSARRSHGVSERWDLERMKPALNSIASKVGLFSVACRRLQAHKD